MKTRTKSFLIGWLALATTGVPEARAELEVSAGIHISATTDFHVPLASHGTWIEVGTHGRCWRPARVAVGWRPYCDGRWLWTDCGWYWASDEPWAWACYHYGTWVYESDFGWVWVPGIEWAPAWVTWRVGGGYCGWAPLAPRGVVVAPGFFAFVQLGKFHQRVRPSTVIVNNMTIINQTRVHGGARTEMRSIGGAAKQRVVINSGPDPGEVEKAGGTRFKQVSIQVAAKQAPVPRDVGRKPHARTEQDQADKPVPPQREDRALDRSPSDVARPGPGHDSPQPGKPATRPQPGKRHEQAPSSSSKKDRGGKGQGRDGKRDPR